MTDSSSYMEFSEEVNEFAYKCKLKRRRKIINWSFDISMRIYNKDTEFPKRLYKSTLTI